MTMMRLCSTVRGCEDAVCMAMGGCYEGDVCFMCIYIVTVILCLVKFWECVEGCEEAVCFFYV